MGEEASAWLELVPGLRQGDRTAEARLIAIYQPRVHCMILARTGSVDTARELSQEVMLQLLQTVRSGRVGEVRNMAAFVHGIARNVVASHRRSATRRAEVPIPDGALAPADLDGLETGERLRLVHRALSRLNAQDRAILWMVLVEGATAADIATQLALQPDVARQRKSRAIRRLREQIAWGTRIGAERNRRAPLRATHAMARTG